MYSVNVNLCLHIANLLSVKTYLLCAFKSVCSLTFSLIQDYIETLSKHDGKAFLSVGPHLMIPCDKPSSVEEAGPPTSHCYSFWLPDCTPPGCSNLLTCIHTCIHGAKNKQLLMGCQRVSSVLSRRPLSPFSRQGLSHRQELRVQDRFKLRPKSPRQVTKDRNA